MLVVQDKKIHPSLYREEPDKVKKNTNIFHKTFFNNIICLTNSIHLNYIYGCFIDRIEIKKIKIRRKKKSEKRIPPKWRGANYLPS
jgi:hypothetical protein